MPGLSLITTTRTLELERARHDADRQRAELAGDLRDDGPAPVPVPPPAPAAMKTMSEPRSSALIWS